MNMQYTKLGNTGVVVSRICLGCMSYGGGEQPQWAMRRDWALGAEEAREHFAAALEAGINFFDTADVYSVGGSEEITGRWLGEMASRDDIVVATKVCGAMGPGANPRDYSSTGDHDYIGSFWTAFETLWLPTALLEAAQQQRLADALFAATRHWSFEIQFDKGLAGAPDDAVAASRDTATNPAVLTAFGLALTGSYGPPAYPGIPGYAPDLADAHAEAAIIGNAMGELRKVAPERAAYVSESNFFEKDWQHSYWGANYERLAAVKRQYDPDGLFFVHHGVGSEGWSEDGFEWQGVN